MIGRIFSVLSFTTIVVVLFSTSPVMGDPEGNQQWSAFWGEQLAQKRQETLPCSPNCASALSGQNLPDQNLDGRITRDEFRGPPSLFDTIDSNRDGAITENETDAFKKRRGKTGSTGKPQGSKTRFLSEAEIREAIVGNTLNFQMPSNGQNLYVYFSEDGSVSVKGANAGNPVVTKKWFINETGMLCRTYGRENKNHCTKVQTTSDSSILTLLNRKLRYQATLTSGRKLPQ